jgi:hypothetical protein
VEEADQEQNLRIRLLESMSEGVLVLDGAGKRHGHQLGSERHAAT